ncbi:hypothetical protein DZF72_07270 [Vibrio parahaemolyticus]|nr:hypothetical protein [Vibrio parahaemolyticus]EGR5855462.1 hypothetical protein [Vibrio parahaemolyticus]HAT8517652.1 hypothetical protein [Vibrio vulnificus]
MVNYIQYTIIAHSCRTVLHYLRKKTVKLSKLKFHQVCQ